MKTFKIKNFAFAFFAFAVLSISLTSCEKDDVKQPANEQGSGKHIVDSRLVGSWMWTNVSSGAYYDDNNIYRGPAYGFATKYIINADGYGSCFNHLYSTLGSSGLEVNISYTGFFESDNQGHLGFFPTSGTYKSTSGDNRPLRADELWNTQTNTGFKFLYQKLVFKTQGEKTYFEVTSSGGVVDRYNKL